MKKITFLLLLITAFGFSQTVVWNNRADFIPAGNDRPVVEQGQVIPMNITFNVPTAGAGSYMEIVIRELDDTFATIFSAFGSTFPPGVTGVTTETTIDFDFTVPLDTPVTADLETGRFWFLAIYVDDTVGGFPGDNNFFDIVAEGSLSTRDFTKNNISSSITQKNGRININRNVVTDTYKLYSLSGAVVLEKEADGYIETSNLSSGVYIVSTDAGFAKVAF